MSLICVSLFFQVSSQRHGYRLLLRMYSVSTEYVQCRYRVCNCMYSVSTEYAIVCTV